MPSLMLTFLFLLIKSTFLINPIWEVMPSQMKNMVMAMVRTNIRIRTMKLPGFVIITSSRLCQKLPPWAAPYLAPNWRLRMVSLIMPDWLEVPDMARVSISYSPVLPRTAVNNPKNHKPLNFFTISQDLFKIGRYRAKSFIRLCLRLFFEYVNCIYYSIIICKIKNTPRHYVGACFTKLSYSLNSASNSSVSIVSLTMSIATILSKYWRLLFIISLAVFSASFNMLLISLSISSALFSE